MTKEIFFDHGQQGAASHSLTDHGNILIIQLINNQKNHGSLGSIR